jgi:alpha/beta superfamily hydrolase
VERVVSKIRTQKNIKVDHQAVEGADHFYRNPQDKTVDYLSEVESKVSAYLERRLAPDAIKRQG